MWSEKDWDTALSSLYTPGCWSAVSDVSWSVSRSQLSSGSSPLLPPAPLQAAPGSVRTGNQSVSETYSPPTPPRQPIISTLAGCSLINQSNTIEPQPGSQDQALSPGDCSVLIWSVKPVLPAQFYPPTSPHLKGQPAKLSARPTSHSSTDTDTTPGLYLALVLSMFKWIVGSVGVVVVFHSSTHRF